MRDRKTKAKTAGGDSRIDGLQDMAELAMQVSATIAGTPKTCRRQVCRRLGRCHLRLEPDGGVECGGRLDAGLVDRAEIMLAFATRLGERSGVTRETIRAIESRLEAGQQPALRLS